MSSKSTPSVRADLEELSKNVGWSWDPAATEVWSSLKALLPGSSVLNPTEILARLNGKALGALASSPRFSRRLDAALRRLRRVRKAAKPPAGLSAKNPVAYFSMEFGVHESLAIYAGGLGILAGDHAKSSSDEAVPLVGVGLFYHNGYFRQELDGAGCQKVIYPKAETNHLPLEPARTKGGKEIRIPVEFPDRVIQLKLWKLHVGRVDLLLLDSDIRENRPEDRTITYRLYGGSREDRIRQEVVAGIGGVRALRACGIEPGAWHLNEGHVAFITLERIRELRKARKMPLEEAVEIVAADTVFTTHTPVPEGNEVFDLALACQYLARHADAAGIPLDDYLALGLDHGRDGKPCLSMTVLALRLSRFRNGVSQLHGEVSRKMWSPLWPGFQPEDVPITSVTNGIHTSTWVAPEMHELISAHLGKDWERHLDDAGHWKRIAEIPEEALFHVKQLLKAELVAFVREREASRLERLGWSSGRISEAVKGLLDPEIFTIGFARRFALYKRSALLFRDLERATRLIGSHARPFQIIYAGKPHPEDSQGKAVFEQVAALAARKELRGRVVLLENYDIDVARHLVQGVDLWLNNPRRPLEASGTSGQKAPINGGLNLSILDGWWCEGYSPATGWAFGKPIDYADHEKQDEEDAADLYRTLEREVLPLYYRRNGRGVPADWFRKVKTSMADLIPRFSTSHMVLEYARRLYKPALENGKRFRASGGRLAREVVAWSEQVRRSWPLSHVRSAKRAAKRGAELEVFLGSLDPKHVACRDNKGRDLATRAVKDLGAGVHRLSITFAGDGFSPLRLYPTHPGLVHPQELGLSIEVVL